uniref:RNA-directed DNA polymerase, eukaryota n=1 Tax=Lactuca sativa TaxID=4236 RepID=A0A9R1W1E0_LACSA|nr:hypothetical protein LSAT_V11C300129770 [Lactuca sativa]
MKTLKEHCLNLEKTLKHNDSLNIDGLDLFHALKLLRDILHLEQLENSKIGKSVPDGVIRDVIMLFLKPLANLGDSSLFVIQNVLKSMLLLRKGITLLLRESEFLIKPYVILSMFVPHKSIFKKKYLWEEIYNLMSSEQERAWIIYGDFNEVGNRRSARDTHLTLKVHMNLINLSIC